jgi:hypothetical protein
MGRVVNYGPGGCRLLVLNLSPSLSRKIVECTWCNQKLSWKIIKVREDKTHPNNESVAISADGSYRRRFSPVQLIYNGGRT